MALVQVIMDEDETIFRQSLHHFTIKTNKASFDKVCVRVGIGSHFVFTNKHGSYKLLLIDTKRKYHHLYAQFVSRCQPVMVTANKKHVKKLAKHK